MEPFEIACPHCGGTLRISNQVLLGRKVKCPKCKDPFTVPTEEEVYTVTADEELEAVGSGVGKLGSSIGSSVYSREEVSFDFAPSNDGEESLEITDEDYSDEEYDEEEDGGDHSYYEKGYIVREEDGKKKYYVARSQRFPWDKAALIGGPIAFLIVAGLLIFWSKGYFSSSKDHRQDATRFSDFGRHVEENVQWVPEADNRYQPPSNKGQGNWGRNRSDRQRRNSGQ